MRVIKLKDLYPDTHNLDIFVVVTNTVAMELTRNYSELDIKPISNIEEFFSIDYALIQNEMERDVHLYNCLLTLSLKQSNRIYEHFYLGITKSEIARIEDCSESAVRKSINQGLIHLRRHMKKYLRE